MSSLFLKIKAITQCCSCQHRVFDGEFLLLSRIDLANMHLTAQYFTITLENSTLQHSHLAQQILAKESHFFFLFQKPTFPKHLHHSLYFSYLLSLFLLNTFFIQFHYSKEERESDWFLLLVYLCIVKLHCQPSFWLNWLAR